MASCSSIIWTLQKGAEDRCFDRYKGSNLSYHRYPSWINSARHTVFSFHERKRQRSANVSNLLKIMSRQTADMAAVDISRLVKKDRYQNRHTLYRQTEPINFTVSHRQLLCCVFVKHIVIDSHSCYDCNIQCYHHRHYNWYGCITFVALCGLTPKIEAWTK